MKINRQNISEEYSTTVDWIKDFERGIEKSANFLESLRSRHYLNNKFNSIEEKMADIKDRVGFDLIGSSKELLGDVVVTAGSLGEITDGSKCGPCSSGKKCGCSDRNSDSYIEHVSNMLSYIKSMAESESDMPGFVIVDKCMSEFGGNESMAEDGFSLDVDKLVSYADALAKDARRVGEEDSDGPIEYVPPESDASDGGVEPAEFSNRTSAG